MPLPLLASSRAELGDALASRGTAAVGFVPTMGALHDGHAGLMRVARTRVGAGPVVASVFVNPLQFGPGEDLDRYPRTLDADLELCGAAGVDVVFAPSVDEVYPTGEPVVTVDPGPLAQVLEGAVRPGHFRGVLTVVAKLFGLVRPDLAVFGEKDYQQLTLIRRMVGDLCLGVEVVGAETRREDDGLAMSSRNRYLDPAERRRATALSQALAAIRQAAADTDRPGDALATGQALLDAAEGVEVDYVALTAPERGPAPEPGPGARSAAGWRRAGTKRRTAKPLPLLPAPPGPCSGRTTSGHPRSGKAAPGAAFEE